MTTREAVRVLNKPGRSAYYGTQVWDAIAAILRALSRPTRLEREASRLLRWRPVGIEESTSRENDRCAWELAFERKRKGKR